VPKKSREQPSIAIPATFTSEMAKPARCGGVRQSRNCAQGSAVCGRTEAPRIDALSSHMLWKMSVYDDTMGCM